MTDSNQQSVPVEESDRDLIKRVRYELSLPVQSQFIREDVRRLANRLERTQEQLEGALQVATNYQGNYSRLQEQKETLLAAAAEYVRVVKEHADALADYADDMDEDAEQIVSSLGFIGNLDRGCLDPEEDSLAQALDVLRDSFPANSPRVVAPTQGDIDRGEELIREGLIPTSNQESKPQ